jgi:hypothetical protein
VRVLEALGAGALFLIGVVSAARSFGHARPGDPPRVRLLILLHDAARAGFWFGLALLFVGYALLDRPKDATWVLLLPLLFAGIRLLTAQALARSLPPD